MTAELVPPPVTSTRALPPTLLFLSQRGFTAAANGGISQEHKVRNDWGGKLLSLPELVKARREEKKIEAGEFQGG